MKIGISYWGYCENFSDSDISNTPDGHRYGRPVLVDELSSRGHQVYSMQQKRETKPYPGILYTPDSFPDLDVLFVEWRWPTYKNFGKQKFETDLDRQTELLDFYHGKIPIIAWDTDLKMQPEDETRWPEMIITDPSFEPRRLTRDRVRLTFWSDFKRIIPDQKDFVEYGYVGNNYERDKMFHKYYGSVATTLRARGIQTKVHGNWLQRSPERDSPESLISRHKNVAFGKRASFKESMHLLGSFVCTAHITKPLYAQMGFASPRYLENIVVGTPGLVPVEFKYNNILGEDWIVSSPKDVVSAVCKIKDLSISQRNELVKEQTFSLLKHHDFSVKNVGDFIESTV